MSSIKHHGSARLTVVFWLIPNDSEKKLYKHIRLLAAQCPVCDQFILEWNGINLENRVCSQHRIAQRDHDLWIARTKTDIDEEMDAARAPKPRQHRKDSTLSPIESTRVGSSLQQFPWSFRMAIVR